MENLQALSPYKLTIVAAIVVVILSVAMVTIFEGPQNAAPYLALVGTVAIPTLINLFKSEQNSVTTARLHEQNTEKIDQLQEEINK